MARTWNRLTANAVRGASKGRYSDGGNLYLQVAEGDFESWLFIFRRDGLRREMGLGSVRSVPLALARELATQCREQLARNLDPIDARRAAAQEQRAARARLQTFRQAAEQYHRDNLTRWRSAKHKCEWLSPLRRFAFPLIGHLGVARARPEPFAGCCSRSWRPSRSLRRACAAGSRSCWTPPRPADDAPAQTRRPST